MAELAGHADLRTTKGYATASAGRRAAAVHDTFDHAPGARERLDGGAGHGG